MRKLNTKLLLVMALLPTLSFAAPTSIEANVPVDHVYTPAGFDSNDNTELVVTGFLPNLCYKAPRSSVSLKDGKISVEVKAIKNQTGLGFCAQVIVPYVEYINVGVLDRGNYQVSVNENTTWEKKSKMAITEATSHSIDENIYANVEEITKGEEGTRKIFLRGSNPSDCFELKEVLVKDNGIDTFSILPKLKQIKANCPKVMMPFSYEVEIPQNLDADKVLLHVRVMDGRSVNAFFNNKPQE